ncbi:hypothetical protein SAMN05428948_1387 [Massilia sp. CF038]|nr:hypothetical protein SAMN05428948_1387 [Massilia sp. CF038]
MLNKSFQRTASAPLNKRIEVVFVFSSMSAMGCGYSCCKRSTTTPATAVNAVTTPTTIQNPCG